MIPLLSRLLEEFKQNFAKNQNMVKRERSFPPLFNKVKVAIGMRRVGKTYFLFQTIRNILEETNVPWQRILYLNFEDDRLLPCKQSQLRELLESFYQLYPDNHQELCYLFLDEIQNVEDWPLVIRRFFDTKNVQIYLSGSSAKLLSKEISTSLRGRSISIEIWPYNFKEYCDAHTLLFTSDLFGQQTHDLMFYHLRKYLKEGGFPETISLEEGDRRTLLQDYVELVIMRDIIERYNITNISLIKYLITSLLKNIGSGFSTNKFVNTLKSQGFSGAKNTIYDYLDYIEDAYLAFSVPLYSESIRKVHSNPKKIYAIDTGLVNAYSFSMTDNMGHLFENLFFLDLKRQGHKIFYYLTQNRYEIDFLTEDIFGEKHLYQVAWDLSNQETLAREMRALDAAEKELGIKGKLITPQTYLQDHWRALQPT